MTPDSSDRARENPEVLRTRAERLCTLAVASYASFWKRNFAQPLSSGGPNTEFKQMVQTQSGPAGIWTDDFEREITLRAIFYLSNARDHLLGLRALLDGHPHGLTVGSAARSVLEATGRSMWLISHHIPLDTGTRRRVARLCIDQEVDAGSYVALKKFSGDQNEIRAAAKRHIQAKMRLRGKDGLFRPSEVQLDDDGRFKALRTERRPTLARLAGLAFSTSEDEDPTSRFVYSYLSDLTHSSFSVTVENLGEPATSSQWLWPFRQDNVFCAKAATISVTAFLNGWDLLLKWLNLAASEREALLLEHSKLVELTAVAEIARAREQSR